ncbi:DEAD/DEAH box helicase [Paenalcaligenes suwonensis]|uniref:DEAD/DEAH box helicase n=1 Tax=Paenalcaligenes suwonensis TaxID=1202713 RepID=UPI00140D3C2D|nr:DEAD/DEAH box helicase [Paenalcaligenes suwonensis]NHC60604.1 DEAD/DEAH box helicase [Paenalcaligenes suwonensis]
MKEATSFDVTQSFSDFGLHPAILSAVLGAGYSQPTPIQAQALPPVMDGRDVMGAAQTGTGKTAAFSLPILHRLMPLANSSASPARHPVRALILTPTRELADQVAASVRLYTQGTPLRSAVVFGGVDIAPQKDTLRRGCEVLVATPGRLLDHIDQKTVNLSQVGILVLDEADRMLDMGFMPDLLRIVQMLPKQRQSLLFSATFSPEIRKLASNFLRDPVTIEVAARNATADTVTQVVYALRPEQKRAAVSHIVKSKGLKQVIAFTNTKAGAARLARELERDGLKAESIHGNKSQLERMKVLDAFKAEELDVLVATDVAARGLDVAGVPCVINVDLPFNAEDYVHRIGRTGRAGASGEAFSLYSPAEQQLLDAIEKLIGRKIKQETPQLAEPERSHRSNNSTSSTNRRSHHSRGQAPLDDFFTKPYQPQSAASSTATEPRNSGNGETRKRSVGVLLGGGRY